MVMTVVFPDASETEVPSLLKDLGFAQDSTGQSPPCWVSHPGAGCHRLGLPVQRAMGWWREWGCRKRNHISISSGGDGPAKAVQLLGQNGQ